MEEDISSKAEKKFFSDRKQLRCVASFIFITPAETWFLILPNRRCPTRPDRSLITTLHLPVNIKLSNLMSAYILDVSKAGRTKELDLLDSASSDSDVSDESMSDESR